MTREPGRRRPDRARGRNAAWAAAGLLVLAMGISFRLLLGQELRPEPRTTASVAASAAAPAGERRAVDGAGAAPGGTAGTLRARPVEVLQPEHEGEPRPPARPGSERAALQAFLARAQAPGADGLALARVELGPDRPLAARLAALRGLLDLQPEGWAGLVAETVLAPPDASRASVELAETALRALGEAAPAAAEARGALLGILGAGELAERRAAAAALAAASPREELPALAARLDAADDAQLLAGVRAGLSKNPAARPLTAGFPAAASPDPTAIPAEDGPE